MVMRSLDDAVRELYFWQVNENASNFTALLFTLMQKADMENAAHLEQAFPFEAQALMFWNAAPDPAAFFRAHGVPCKQL